MRTLIAQPGAFERLLVAYARGFPVRRGKVRVVNALWRKAAGADTRREAVTRFAGLRMPCDLGEALQRQYYFFGTYFLEEHILTAWCAAARGARIVFDVGANGGIYSLAALAIEPAASVHAFEPTPEIAERLRQTAELNRLAGLRVHQTAVSDQDGFALLRRCGADVGGNEGMNYIVADAAGADGERVTTVRLDTVCRQSQVDRIDLLKLDVQGAEAAALEGVQDLLAAGRVGWVFMELNWGVADPCPATAAVRRLEAAGYVFAAPAARLEWRAAGDWLRRLGDVIARPAAQVEAARG
jgi:FkbM family methyltransferase